MKYKLLQYRNLYFSFQNKKIKFKKTALLKIKIMELFRDLFTLCINIMIFNIILKFQIKRHFTKKLNF